MSNEMILLVGMVIILFYILSSSTLGERLKTFLLMVGHAGLIVADFVPERRKWGYRSVTRIKLPTKVVQVKSVEEFIQMAEEHNQDTVYRNRLPAPWGVAVHYVFNQDKTNAWSYYAW